MKASCSSFTCTSKDNKIAIIPKNYEILLTFNGN